jgi:hypothetical protein
MDFNQLLSRMQELDVPAAEAVTDECGMMPPAPMKQDTPPPSMTVNVNAQGMDNIESMLALMAKLNDAGKADMPSMAPMPQIMPLDKMLPPMDMDADNDDKVGGEKDSMDLPKDHDDDHVIIKSLDKDGDKDHDMDDHKKETAPTTMKASPGSDEDDDVNRYPDGSVVGPTGDPDGGSASDEEKNEAQAPGTGTAAAMKGVDEKDPDAADAMKPGTANAMPDDDDEVGMGDDDLKDDIAALLQLAGQKLEAYMNEPDEVRKDADYMNNKLAGGMNRPKDAFKPAATGDNPMKVRESDEPVDLKSQIRAELAAKLEQFMGAK